MFDRWRYRIGTWYARTQYRSKRDPIIRFNDVLSSAKRALVILPEVEEDLPAVQSTVRVLCDKFHRGAITIVGRDNQPHAYARQRGIEVISYTEEDLTSFFLPRHELLQKVKKSTFDVAFDLNRSFSLSSAVLCRASHAPVRVGFTKSYADEFYNFQIHITPALSLTQAYATLNKCLEMF
jgi:ADP-heptose:LPS heptosyltransferase